jgi:S1-C subfamily serine protease
VQPAPRPNNGLRRTALLAAADAERKALPREKEVNTLGQLQRFMILLLLCLAFPSLCKSQEVTSNILQRVFLIKYGQEFGASFTIDVQNRQYLITSKHLVGPIKEGDSVEIFHESQWKSVRVKPLYMESSDVDIIILVLPMQISPSHPLELGSDGLIVSQNVYFLGFPFGLNLDGRTLNNGYPLPLVKHGVCSGFYFSPNKYSLVLIDGINNPGFSGGPVVYVDQATRGLKVAAVVSAYRNQEDKVLRRVKKQPSKKTNEKNNTKETLIETDMIVRSNAGIIISYSINSALDVIAKNPIGPIITK